MVAGGQGRGGQRRAGAEVVVAVLCRLADPAGYVPCEWDLAADDAGRRYWLDHFTTHSETTLDLARGRWGAERDFPDRLAGFRREFAELLERMRSEPGAFSPFTILTLDEHREVLLRKWGFDDPFADVKRLEDDAAIPLYTSVVADLAGHEGVELIEMLVRGIFAGNIFDLGSIATIEAYNRDGLDFYSTRASQPGRPWLHDGFDRLAERLLACADGGGYRQVLFFVDNAGADLLLGCLPMARQLAIWGVRVVLAANSRPSLNDVTEPELRRVLGELASLDPTLAELMAADRIAVVASGCEAPLIDLARVTDACNEAARDADLVILEGLGRSVESNFNVRFDCDCLKICLLKDREVAARIGGELFDCVCRFDVV